MQLQRQVFAVQVIKEKHCVVRNISLKTILRIRSIYQVFNIVTFSHFCPRGLGFLPSASRLLLLFVAPRIDRSEPATRRCAGHLSLPRLCKTDASISRPARLLPDNWWLMRVRASVQFLQCRKQFRRKQRWEVRVRRSEDYWPSRRSRSN